MTSVDRYTEVKRIFLEASRLPRGDRTRYLNAQCAEDVETAAHVRRLLTLDESDPEFLETPALGAEQGGLPPGTRLGRFTVIRLLGEGGMGVVYEAEEDEPRRVVALKLVRPGIFSERLRSRFRHEIRVLGQLRHPGIAQIYEAGSLDLSGDRVPYFAMELVRGRPLLDAARERGLGHRARLELLAQVCDAVHHAHQKGVIHRDLKPGNILVEEWKATGDPSGGGAAPGQRVKVLDFGIARVTDAQVTVQTDPGQFMGTLPYMSPEQAAEPDSLDTRSDVYSIGVIAFELLSGRLPYPVMGLQLPEAARLIHAGEPMRLGTFDSALRGDIETIVGKALERDRAHRYQSAAELGADIWRYLRDEPIVARPASALYQLRKFARRHRTLLVAAFLVFAAMGAATTVSVWQARIALRAKAFAESEQARASRNAEAARRQARRAVLAAAAAAVESGDPITARQTLESVDAGDRGWVWRYWAAKLDNSIAVIRPPGPVMGVWFAPAGDRVRLVTPDGRLSEGGIWDGGTRLGPILQRVPVAAAAFTADGTRVIAVCGPTRRSLDEFDARDGSLVRHIADLPARGALVEVSDDGAVIVVALKRQGGAPIADDVWIWDHDAPGRSIRSHGRTSGIALAADGRTLAFGYDGGLLWESDGSGLRLLTGSRGDTCYAVSMDGSRFALGGEDKAVHNFERDAPAPLNLMVGHAGNITALAFDSAGSVLASAGTDQTIRLWEVASGRPVGTLLGHSARIRDLRYSRDGTRLLSRSDDGTLRVWTRDPYDSVCVLHGHTSYVYGVALTPDGGRIVSGGWDSAIRVWDAAGGECQRVISATDSGYITALAVAPEGTMVASGHKTGEWDPAGLHLWDIESGEEIAQASIGRGELHGLSFGQAGNLVYMGWEHGAVGVADLSAHPLAVRTLIPRHATFAVALSPDDHTLALGGAGGWVRVMDTGRLVQSPMDFGDAWIGHRGHVTALAWSPTRPLLASAAADSTIRLWNSETHALVARLDRHWGKVFALAFSPDGKCLASGSDDTTIRIWDADGGDDLTQLRGHEGYVYSLAFSPDGSMLVSGSGDGTVRVWDTRPVHERWRARAEAARLNPGSTSTPPPH